jgi:hypothetical protein
VRNNLGHREEPEAMIQRLSSRERADDEEVDLGATKTVEPINQASGW